MIPSITCLSQKVPVITNLWTRVVPPDHVFYFHLRLQHKRNKRECGSCRTLCRAIVGPNLEAYPPTIRRSVESREKSMSQMSFTPPLILVLLSKVCLVSQSLLRRRCTRWGMEGNYCRPELNRRLLSPAEAKALFLPVVLLFK